MAHGAVATGKGAMMTTQKATDLTWHQSTVRREERQEMLAQVGCALWFTGLPSSGKSTTAFALERALIGSGHLAFVLDGDNVRHGLNKNLGFSAEDRAENIRRIGEVAKLFAEAGLVTMTAFISPYRRDRDQARALHAAVQIPFVEIFVDTPLAVCEERDPKGLYRKARRGELRGFTGIDDPYEPPLRPELVLKTTERGPEELAAEIRSYLETRQILKPTARDLR
jgi:adenylylsulfate kinase